VAEVSAPTAGAPETAAVRAMFDRIAPRYDLLNRVLSLGTDVRWRRQAVSCLELEPAGRLLDLCTGTADLLAEALARDRRSSGVLGARKLARRDLAARARLVAGDAVRLPVRDAAFDGALVAFGIRNVGEPRRALSELLRALRPGGRLVVLEFSSPNGAFGALFRLYFRHLLPRVAALLSDASAYSYLPASVARFPSPSDFARLLQETGFADVRCRSLTGGIACLFRGEKPSARGPHG
jgi:demethylmenaquinone methyltransferase/2-methoxy-6-polyprenyl-1,4-benzoquinol methylase